MSTSSNELPLDSTASIGGNEPLPTYGMCGECGQETDIRGYACIDCLRKSADMVGEAQHDVLEFLDDEDSARPGRYEGKRRRGIGGEWVVKVDFNKSVREVVHVCKNYRSGYLTQMKSINLLNVREQWSRDRIKLLEAENEELKTRIAPPPEPDDTRKLDL